MSDKAIISSGLHHVAFATRDPKACYDYYHNKLGMPLVHSESHKQGDGWFRHFFFDMGEEQYLAFFEFENIGERPDYKIDISLSLGVPPFINHVAFKIKTEEDFEAIKKRLEDNGVLVAAEVDHEWCKSIYLIDPNDIMVEFSITYNEEKWTQTPQEAYDNLFNSSVESLGEDSEKNVVDPN